MLKGYDNGVKLKPDKINDFFYGKIAKLFRCHIIYDSIKKF